MEEYTCGGCAYFFRHYIKEGGTYRPLPMGHCVYPRLKNRECGTTACGKFTRPRKKSRKTGSAPPVTP